MPMTETTVCLGIDVGGTYTDAVIFSPANGVIAKAKALTSRRALHVGIFEAADKAIEMADVQPEMITLVSISTTLATNTLIEKKAEPAALVLIGFNQNIMNDKNLANAVDNNPVVFCPGGHDGFGNEFPLDLTPLEAQLPKLKSSVSGVAICGSFAVRNSEHELAARDLIKKRINLPTTMSHALSTVLGGPKRAVTAVLNAGLVPGIDRLLSACEYYLNNREISSPLMIVRGDGSLVSAAFARNNPIETILSGPAAGLVGAQYLSSLTDAVVSDIGGTTTDVTIIENGKPRLNPEGATVGGFQTMVQAVESFTYGIGGDSEIGIGQKENRVQLTVGPRRLVPLALLAVQFGPSVLEILEDQSRKDMIRENDGRFVLRSDTKGQVKLSDNEQVIIEKIGENAVPLNGLTNLAGERSALKRLVNRGIVAISGFTPSDAAHVLGRQSTWQSQASMLGAEIFSRQRDKFGTPLAPSGADIAERVLKALTRASAEAIFQTAFSFDDKDGVKMVSTPAFQHALNRNMGLVTMRAQLKHPLIGLGASAEMHYETLPALLGNEHHIVPHADVANAVGAVVGQVSVSLSVYIQSLSETFFRVTAGSQIADYRTLEEALDSAEHMICSVALEKAHEAGAVEAENTISRSINMVTVEGRQTFVDAVITAVATGRPNLE